MSTPAARPHQDWPERAVPPLRMSATARATLFFSATLRTLTILAAAGPRSAPLPPVAAACQAPPPGRSQVAAAQLIAAVPS